MTEVHIYQRRKTINSANDILIRRCQSGEINAYREMYELYAGQLFSIALRMTASKEDAEDALHNTFIKLQSSIHQFRFESKFSSYIIRILINVCYDIINKRKDILTLLQNEDIVFDENYELCYSLEAAIQKLPLKMRECFILFAVEGFKQNEIADILNIKIGSVKAHIFQARRKLRDILQ